jgi:hypothetical protein
VDPSPYEAGYLSAGQDIPDFDSRGARNVHGGPTLDKFLGRLKVLLTLVL